eukprot:gene2837-3130_t
MPGGGYWRVGPGQVTDDSEMALCLMQALMHHPASTVAPLDDIAAMYIRWLNSPPFDIGMTTRNALQAADAEGISKSQNHGLAAEMIRRAEEWLSEALQGGSGPAVCEQEGFIKWGFVHAFRSMHLQLSYDEAITQVLLLGGDTDTNAAIVGGMMGALWGASAIPEGLAAPVLQRDVGSPGRQRPQFLQTKQLPQLFDQLWAASSL